MNSKVNADLTNYNGLKIAAVARRFETILSLAELKEVLQTLGPEAPVHILGHGTNTIWGAPVIERTVLKMEIPGFEVLEENLHNVLVRIGAGENWDVCVGKCVKLGFSDIEALSGIPGTAGAGPVQNIGAYGREIGEVIESVTVFDRKINQTKILDRSACRLGYRDSIFKHEGKALIIIAVTLRLSKLRLVIPNYSDIISHFKDQNISNPNLAEIRQAILDIRLRKLPDPKVIPNCGSFFKNPIIDIALATELQVKFPDMPQYSYQDKVKVSAGWMIDRFGMKGRRFGGIEIYQGNALVLTAPESMATIEDIYKARDYIVGKVLSEFGIQLEMEPEIIQ